MLNDKAICPRCEEVLEEVLFTEEEEIFDKDIHAYIKTGRKRTNVSYLECPHCGHRETVDDSFAGPWH